MAGTTHTPGPPGTIPPFHSAPRANSGVRIWPARSAVLVWIAASAAVWAIVVGSAAVLL